ncbi:hypothetical protein [Flavobacterium sp.]|jgi:hypothetical protein|uniref:hypothetical protein n=1 Tax=Flavobacterium sp. TaxID=239 RepID=UPI0037C19E10
MKKITFLFLALILASCGVKQTTNRLTSGDYDGAIESAVRGLRGNKNAKGKQDYVYLLEEAFAKAKERDLRNIETWSQDANPANLEKIFNAYINLNNRQELIRPLLPLKLLNEGRDAIFPMENYSTEIVNSKNALSNYLYTSSKNELKTANKLQARAIVDDLVHLNQINPGFKDVNSLLEEARFKGTDFVHVYTKNETNIMIPVRLQNDLLDFSTYGLNDKWTVYHSNRQQGITYDFGIILNFREINISPEQIREKEVTQEKQIKDGVKNLVDANGNIVRDSLGNPIKVDKFITVKGTAYQFTQFKACQVTAKVDYIDFNNNQLINSYPLASEFIFEHIYATVRGDRRAFDEQFASYFGRRAVPFPSNEQMVYDTGEDLKAKLKDIISRNRIRR